MLARLLLLAVIPCSWASAQSLPKDILGSYQQAMVNNRSEARPRAFSSGPGTDGRFSSWTYHSNGLVGAWTYGSNLDLSAILGRQSAYRSSKELEQLYGQVPQHTLQAKAEYGDQTGLSRILRNAASSGAKQIFVVVVDGLGANFVSAASDWYGSEALAWLAYEAKIADEPTAQSGRLVTSSHTSGTLRGGFDPTRALGPAEDLYYLTGQTRSDSEASPHAVTDSAASASSIFSGIKTYNGSINYDINGKAHEPLGAFLQAKGWRVGAVTDVPFSHATPAAFYAQAPQRRQHWNIAKQMLGRAGQRRPDGRKLSGLDLVMGSGYEQPGTDPSKTYIDPEDLSGLQEDSSPYLVHIPKLHVGSDALRSAANEVIHNIGQKSGPQRLFVFTGDESLTHLPYRTANGDYLPVDSIASVHNGEQRRRERETYSPEQLRAQPNLATMTQVAIEVLAAHQERFALLVEAGQFDWAMHANSVDNGMGEILSVAQVFDCIRDWVERQPGGWDDAVLVITADHDHAIRFDQEAYAKLRAGDMPFWIQSTRE